MYFNSRIHQWAIFLICQTTDPWVYDQTLKRNTFSMYLNFIHVCFKECIYSAYKICTSTSPCMIQNVKMSVLLLWTTICFVFYLLLTRVKLNQFTKLTISNKNMKSMLKSLNLALILITLYLFNLDRWWFVFALLMQHQ